MRTRTGSTLLRKKFYAGIAWPAPILCVWDDNYHSSFRQSYSQTFLASQVVVGRIACVTCHAALKLQDRSKDKSGLM